MLKKALLWRVVEQLQTIIIVMMIKITLIYIFFIIKKDCKRYLLYHRVHFKKSGESITV